MTNNKMARQATAVILCLSALSCWSGPSVRQIESQTPSIQPSVTPLKGPKARVAIARFTHKNPYGENLFGLNADLGTQAADILAGHLVRAKQFTLIERKDLDLLARERDVTAKEPELATVNALILGSVTEYGFKVEAQNYGVQKRKQQTAH